jgi:hypothetical protein
MMVKGKITEKQDRKWMERPEQGGRGRDMGRDSKEPGQDGKPESIFLLGEQLCLVSNFLNFTFSCL